MKYTVNTLVAFASILLLSCTNSNADESNSALQNAQKNDSVSVSTNSPAAQTAATDNSNGTVIHLTNASFKEKVFNYDASQTWKYNGNKPCIIDFYATWCGPCKRMSPILDEIAKEYAGKIIIYKVDTDKEKELAGALGITSLPTLIFCPLAGQPQGSMGAISKEDLKKAIATHLLTN